MLFIVYSYIVSAVFPCTCNCNTRTVCNSCHRKWVEAIKCAAAVQVQVQFWAVLAHLVSPLSAIS